MNKIFLTIFSLAYIITILTIIGVFHQGFRFWNAFVTTLVFLVILALYLTGSAITKNADPVKKGAVWGGAIGIISFLGSLNWYFLCYRKWCDALQAIRFFNWMNLPLANFWMIMGNLWDGLRLTMAFSNFIIFLLLGVLFGYIYKKNKRVFWYSLIGFIILYLIMGLVALRTIFAGFG